MIALAKARGKKCRKEYVFSCKKYAATSKSCTGSAFRNARHISI